MTTRTCVTCIYKSGARCTKQWAQAPGDSVNPVTGAVTRIHGSHFSCETQRKYTFASCGAEGKWWEPITPQAIIKKRRDEDNGPNIFHRAITSVLSVFRD